jgi:hypothetical protein
MHGHAKPVRLAMGALPPWQDAGCFKLADCCAPADELLVATCSQQQTTCSSTQAEKDAEYTLPLQACGATAAAQLRTLPSTSRSMSTAWEACPESVCFLGEP